MLFRIVLKKAEKWCKVGARLHCAKSSKGSMIRVSIPLDSEVHNGKALASIFTRTKR